MVAAPPHPLVADKEAAGMARPRPSPRRGRDLPSRLPAHALLFLEERLREQEAEGVRMPEGMEWDELGASYPDRS
jgi:hypothetical protein